MGVINIVSGRFFSFFSMTRFLACANVLRLDEYDFLYLPLCKRKLDFSNKRQVIWTFNQKFPKMAKNSQKWTKMSATAIKNQAYQVFESVGYCKYFKVRVNSKYISDCSK